MKYFITLSLCLFLLFSCEEPRKLSSTDKNQWEMRTVKKALPDSLDNGSTFLSVYSQIFMRNDKGQVDLTATVSLHNPNSKDKIYIDKAVYYNTKGEAIRIYFDKTIFINPMETVQIVIDGIDREGGTGANFIFDWKIKSSLNEPIIEAVMISTNGQQGISFTTSGKRIK
ncbi:DUF3124 domain-containing protein [Aquimarina agarivorans]|uniref:DUF3124 domain-containing protein n=1 Tax=Aquimarina agarivorans TaxID=980584 RepID=UPI0004981A5E|nr:DUF3124 domain-containing protein [Aquimarina agarivorans]